MNMRDLRDHFKTLSDGELKSVISGYEMMALASDVMRDLGNDTVLHTAYLKAKLEWMVRENAKEESK